MTPVEARDWLRGLGRSADTARRPSGLAVVEVRGPGPAWTLLLYGCADRTDPGSAGDLLQFNAAFVHPFGRTKALETANLWNATRVVGKALVGDGEDLLIEHAVGLRGLLPDGLRAAVATWEDVLADFASSCAGA